MENPLARIVEGLKGKDGHVAGVDVGSSFLKVVQLHKKAGKVYLDTYGEIALGPLAGLEIGQSTALAAETVASAIKDVFTEAHVSAKQVVISIPLTSTLLTIIEMPDMGEAKLAEMVPIEARRYIPTAASEVTLRHWVVPRPYRNYVDPDKENDEKAIPKVDVLLAAVHNDVLKKYEDIAALSGASNASFEIEIFSTIRSILGKDSAPAMILDIGGANTKVAMIEEGVLRSSHLITSGSQDITVALAKAKNIPLIRAEEIKREYGLKGDPADPAIAEISRLSVQRIFAEANRILEKYEQQNRLKVGKVLLSGGGALLQGITDLASASFSSSVIYGDPFDKAEHKPELNAVLKEAGPEFAVAVGLALRNL